MTAVRIEKGTGRAKKRCTEKLNNRREIKKKERKRSECREIMMRIKDDCA